MQILLTINSGVSFITDEDDLVVGYQMVFGDEENYFASDPILLEWPLQQMPLPDAFKNRVN